MHFYSAKVNEYTNLIQVSKNVRNVCFYVEQSLILWVFFAEIFMDRAKMPGIWTCFFSGGKPFQIPVWVLLANWKQWLSASTIFIKVLGNIGYNKYQTSLITFFPFSLFDTIYWLETGSCTVRAGSESEPAELELVEQVETGRVVAASTLAYDSSGTDLPTLAPGQYLW